MPAKDRKFHTENSRTIAEIIASDGCMEGKAALRIIRALCGLYLDDAETGETGLPYCHPQRLLLSPTGRISFSNDIADPIGEAYLPPEYNRDNGSTEGTVIYGLGMLLLFLVTGQENKSELDARVNNAAIREIIVQCTALDSKRRFQSLVELYAFLNSEIRFPRKHLRRIAITLALCLTAGASVFAYFGGRSREEAKGSAAGYELGYKEGYENGASDAPGIGLERIIIPDGCGNLPGNLNADDGAFAAFDGENIYFTCSGRLYKMDPYTKKIQFLLEHDRISNLNYQADWLYYQADDGIMRLNVRSRGEEPVCDGLQGSFCLCDGTLYLDDEYSAGYLYGVDLNSLETRQLNAETEYHYLNVTEEKLFYADPDRSGYLFSSDHDGGRESRLISRACRDIEVCGSRIYCLISEDPDSTVSNSDAGLLACMDIEGGDMEILTNRPVRKFVAADGGIFYTAADSGCLEWMTLTGETGYKVCDFAVSDFNIVDGWIFYKTGRADALYRMRITGAETEKIQ